MRQQHDLDSARHEQPSAGRPYDGLDADSAPSRAPAPRPASQRATGVPSLADLAGLTRLLVAPVPVERAITAAVERAAQLVPTARQLALYALDPAHPGRLNQLAAAHRDHPGALPQLDAEPHFTDTLGHGERADRQVLVERGMAHPTGATLLPLTTARDALLGALVVEHTPAAPRPEATVLGMIAATLGSLLDRRASAEEQQRAGRALAALPALAFAPPAYTDEPEPAAEGDPEAQTRSAEEAVAALLRAGARELGVLAAARACIALVRTSSGAWSALPGSELPGDIGITPAQAEALLPALADGPMTIAPDQNDMLWSELAPLRQRGGYPDARVHLIAATGPQEVFAIYAIAEGQVSPPEPRWLPLARALAASVAAGIAARHLASQVRDEAREREAYISLVAHELRSPMTAIKGYAQLLIRQAQKQPLPEPMMRSVDAVEQQSQRLSEMLGELLDASRLRRGNLQIVEGAVDLGAALQRVVERRRAMYPQHTITLSLPPQQLTVTGEAARVEQVLRDLIDNAARHSPGSGEIAVTLTTPRADEALITVRDRGVGVAPEDREPIFEYLYRAPRSQERNLSGLGLGLYVSRHLIEHMGGRLWLETSSTEPPTGSEFRFTLPLA